MPQTKPEPKLIAENRKARFDYFIEDRYEAGMVLQGWEVKSMRAGKAQLTESYAYVKNGEAFLYGAHIAPLTTTSTHFIAEPTRTRKLLLNLAELEQLANAVEREGYTLVPLEMYWKAGRAKLTHRRRQGQEAARQARHREGPRLAARQGPHPAHPLNAQVVGNAYVRLKVTSESVFTRPAGGLLLCLTS